jgi:hypothetical protein
VSRINGENPVYRTIGEFGSPFAAGATGASVTAFKVMVIVAALSAIVAIAIRRRRTDWGALLFAAGLAVLAAGARRNIALFAIGSAPAVAAALGALRQRSTRLALVAPGTVRTVAGAFAVVGAIGAAIAGARAITSGAFYRWENAPQEFGAGVIEGTFPDRAVAFARAASLPGPMFNDMAAGGYLAWDDPTGLGVYVDGRLEVYDTALLTEFVQDLENLDRWKASADRAGIQTAIVFHRFEKERQLVGWLAADPAWSLVYGDEVAAVFLRAGGNDDAAQRAAAQRDAWNARTAAWLARPAVARPYPAGRIEGTRAYARFLATVGFAEPAIEAYKVLVQLGITKAEEVDVRLRLARYFVNRERLAEAREQTQRILALDPANRDVAGLLR